MFDKDSKPGYVSHRDVVDSVRSQRIDLSGTAFPQALAATQPLEGRGKHEQTLMQSLTAGQNFPLVVNANIQQYAIKKDASQSFAASTQVSPNLQAVNTIDAQVDFTRAAICNAIDLAQKEIILAASMAGHDAGKLYPNNHASKTDVGSALQAVGPAALNFVFNGAGSAVTALAGATSSFATILGDRKTRNKDADRDIAEILSAKSSSPSAMNNFQAVIMGADPQRQGIPNPKLNWEAALRNDSGALKTIMSLNPHEPNPAIVPEIALLDSQKEEIATVKTSLGDVDKHKYDAGNTGELVHAIRQENIQAATQIARPKIDSGDINDRHALLHNVMKVSMTSKGDDFDEVKKRAMPALGLEFRPENKDPRLTSTFNPTMS